MDTALVFATDATAPDSIVEEIPVADLVIAADGGYDLAVRLGFAVDVLVGDLDSLDAATVPDHIVVERHPTDKEATDLELALELVSRESPSRVVIVGGSGGRLDHELAGAALICSPRWTHDIGTLDWLSSRGWAYVVWDRRIIHGDPGTVVSLIPMGGNATGVVTKGLRWDLRDETLPHGTTRGVSNLMESPIADISLRSGCLLVVVAV